MTTAAIGKFSEFCSEPTNAPVWLSVVIVVGVVLVLGVTILVVSDVLYSLIWLVKLSICSVVLAKRLVLDDTLDVVSVSVV